MTDAVLDLLGHLGERLFEAFRLEYGIPAEHILTARLTDRAITAASEDDGLGIRTLAECKDALSVGCLVVEVLDHLPETLTTDVA